MLLDAEYLANRLNTGKIAVTFQVAFIVFFQKSFDVIPVIIFLDELRKFIVLPIKFETFVQNILIIHFPF